MKLLYLCFGFLRHALCGGDTSPPPIRGECDKGEAKMFFFMKFKGLIAAMILVAVPVCAEEESTDKNIFNHLSVGINVGTPGIGVDLAMPICNYVQVRAGVSFVPNIKFNTDLDINPPSVSGYDIPSEVEVEAKVGFTNGKVLFDVYPFRRSSFFVTAGAYFGSSKVIKAYNEEDGLLIDLAKYNNDVEAGVISGDKIGVELGDYLLEPDDDGNVNARIKTASFKPYVGLGFGRAVPKTKSVGFMFEIGCQFWGSPKVYCNDTRLHDEDVDGDGGSIMKTISKITVYPVINFRICGKIF